MANEPFSPSFLETARKHIAGLFEAYQAATGYKPTFVSIVVMGDRTFAIRHLKTGMNITTYDLFVGRMSCIWPQNTPWPDGIPRQAPVALDDAGAELLAEREAARATAASQSPQIADWPEDIPRPEPII